MAKILIAGCGDLGSGLATELVAQGHSVTGIRRTLPDFPAGVEGITGDLVFFVPSTSVYGQNQGEWIDETTPARPTSATAKVLLETEQSLAAVFSSVSVRCSGIYGSGRYRLLETVLSESDWGANSWTNRIHRDDVVAALVLLANCALSEKQLPAQVIVTDQTPVSMWEVKLWLATCLEAKVAVSSGEGFVPTSGKRIQGQYLLSQGWRLQYPSYVSGYHELLREFKGQLE